MSPTSFRFPEGTEGDYVHIFHPLSKGCLSALPRSVDQNRGGILQGFHKRALKEPGIKRNPSHRLMIDLEVG
jgi:hypothetical protein